MKINFRSATVSDLDALLELEREAFAPFQQCSRASLRRGLSSHSQEIFVLEHQDEKPSLIASVVLFKYTHRLRIYSIAVAKAHRKSGFGHKMMNHIHAFAWENGFSSMSLEVLLDDSHLRQWYERQGFRSKEVLYAYYSNGADALRMTKELKSREGAVESFNLIVMDQAKDWKAEGINAQVVSVKDYLHQGKFQNQSGYRVYNLCSSYAYQRFGYYVSLLASARGQRVVPSSSSIKDVQIANVVQSMAFDLKEEVEQGLAAIKGNRFSLEVYFGQTTIKKHQRLASNLYQIFEVPLLSVQFVRAETWIIKSIKALTFKQLNEGQKNEVYEAARRHFNKKRFRLPKLSNYRYDIAVLVDPTESHPPSNAKALENFKKAANSKGVYLEFITGEDRGKINEFDALFIRETTQVNHLSYELSRLAFAEGLVVIDDPWSILRCSNKIYQHELFKKHRIGSPKTLSLTRHMLNDKALESLVYPLVLKQPDSAFSLGVIKVESSAEAKEALVDLFKKTDMVIVQEFLYSEFDWRIGVLDNKPLFACKYFMTPNHWQIYNWSDESTEQSGAHLSLALEDVPPAILRTAVKAAALIGDGLYGVDLKIVHGKVYVIEVNDNPNIDAGVEDEVLGQALYDQILDHIITRIEAMKNLKHISL